MKVTKRGVHDTNNKLKHLELGHLLLPLRPVGGSESCLAIVQVEEDMNK